MPCKSESSRHCGLIGFPRNLPPSRCAKCPKGKASCLVKDSWKEDGLEKSARTLMAENAPVPALALTSYVTALVICPRPPDPFPIHPQAPLLYGFQLHSSRGLREEQGTLDGRRQSPSLSGPSSSLGPAAGGPVRPWNSTSSLCPSSSRAGKWFPEAANLWLVCLVSRLSHHLYN